MADIFETEVGLPNTCCVCGKPNGKTWWVRNLDEARAGGGMHLACIPPDADYHDQPVEPAREPFVPAPATPAPVDEVIAPTMPYPKIKSAKKTKAQ